jgi:hypothetical protein
MKDNKTETKKTYVKPSEKVEKLDIQIVLVTGEMN